MKQERECRACNGYASLDSTLQVKGYRVKEDRTAICKGFMCNHESYEDVYPALGFMRSSIISMLKSAHILLYVNRRVRIGTSPIIGDSPA